MSVLAYRLEDEIRQRASEGDAAMRDLLRKLDNIRPVITRQEAWRLEVLIEAIFKPVEGP